LENGLADLDRSMARWHAYESYPRADAHAWKNEIVGEEDFFHPANLRPSGLFSLRDVLSVIIRRVYDDGSDDEACGMRRRQ
jgi:hypothetical protein